MPHWSEAYVGLPYVEGSFDCAALAERVQLEVFGKQLALPSERAYLGKGPIGRWHAMQAQIDQVKRDLTERVETPAEGDAVLLRARGYFQHVGIYCCVNGEPWVLHANESARQVVMTRLRELANRGMTIEGYYRWA